MTAVSSVVSLSSSISISSSSASEDESSHPPTLLDKFKWHEINFETLRCCIEPVRRLPPLAESSPEAYTTEVLQHRRRFLDQVIVENPYKTPNAWRYASCCGYFLGQAQRASIHADALHHGNRDESTLEWRRLQACRQILLFDRTQTLNPHPCDFPTNQLGGVYVSSAVVMLRYTIYNRYRHYIGRGLDTLNFPIRAVLRKMWHTAYVDLIKESGWLANKRESAGHINRAELPNIVVHSIAFRMNQLLRLRPLTTERAIESLEKYARHRHKSGCWMGTPDTEVCTFELENMVHRSNHRRLAEVLYSDLIALDSLKRFELEDVELVHIQAIIRGLIEFFFDVKLSEGHQDADVSDWRPSPMFFEQRLHFLRDGGQWFSDPIQWRLRIRGEKAEERFGNAWRALCRNQDKSPEGVQRLLGGYLRSLGVEEASIEQRLMKPKIQRELITDSDEAKNSRAQKSVVEFKMPVQSPEMDAAPPLLPTRRRRRAIRYVLRQAKKVQTAATSLVRKARNIISPHTRSSV